MIIFKIFSRPYFPRLMKVRSLQTETDNVQEIKNIQFLCKHLNICEIKAQSLIKKRPVIANLNEERIKSLLECLDEIGLPKEILVEKPVFFGIDPITIKRRHQVLIECGMDNMASALLATYLQIMKRKTIGELKKSGYIPAQINVENRLSSYLKHWPKPVTPSTNDRITLYTLRLRIMQKYLELFIDVTNEEFQRAIKTYDSIAHRPLGYINEALSILQSQIGIPNLKIKSNLYLLYADPENLKNILKHFQSLGGIDMREVIKMYPRIAVVNFQNLLEIKKLLEEYQISNEAQQRCFNIYNLSVKSVKERLEEAKNMPEFNIYYKHPSFLNMIYRNNLVIKRLNTLNKNNKKCITLNILLRTSTHYKDFVKSSNDKLSKGKDLIFCIYELLGRKFSKSQIRDIVQRHPFWLYTPLLRVKHIHEQLSTQYTDQEIFENCQILLYPLEKVEVTAHMLQQMTLPTYSNIIHEKLNFNLLNNSQKLSLVLYILERNHDFSGNGVWLDKENVNIDELIKHNEADCKASENL